MNIHIHDICWNDRILTVRIFCVQVQDMKNGSFEASFFIPIFSKTRFFERINTSTDKHHQNIGKSMSTSSFSKGRGKNYEHLLYEHISTFLKRWGTVLFFLFDKFFESTVKHFRAYTWT